MAEKAANKTKKKPVEEKPDKKAETKAGAEKAKVTKAETKPTGVKVGKPKAEGKKVAAETKKDGKPKKSKLGWIIGLIVVMLLAVVGVVVALVCSNQTDPSDPTAKLGYSDAFFIYDNSKYTLWNAEGRRLTEDEYSSQTDFVGGYALVKKDDQYGIIRDNGNMSVDYGKYGNVAVKGGLYLAQDGNTKEYFLITGSGKELVRGSDLEVSAPSYTSGFAAVKADNKVRLYNYAGKLVIEMDEIYGADDPIMNGSQDFGILHYGEQNVVFDARNGGVVAKFEGSRHTFDTISDSRKIIILKNYDDSSKYKLLADGKIYDLDETKYYGITTNDNVLGYDNYTKLALLNEDYKIAKWVSTYLELKDYKNYAVETDNGAEIYYNGEMVKEFGDGSGVAASGVLYENYYAIEGNDGKFRFYNLDGTVAFNHEYKDIRSVFDQHHHAVVSDEDGVYYLINAKNEKVGDYTAKAITESDGGYELKNADGEYAIANKNGDKVTDFKYDSLYYRSGAEPHNIWTGRNSYANYDVIDADAGKVLVEGVNVDSFYTNYFTIKNSDKKTEYYTYGGEKFYTSEK